MLSSRYGINRRTTPRSITKTVKGGIPVKKALTLLLLCVVLFCLCANASANQWGLEGPMLDFVLGTHDYDDYSYVFHDFDSQAGTVAAVFSNTRNSQLVILQNDGGKFQQLGRYPAAVRQPSGDHVPRWDVRWLPNDGFSMTLENGDSYEFTWDGFDEWNSQKQLALHSAQTGGLTFSAAGEEYSVECGVERVIWQTNGLIKLRDFCIELMPQSLDEIRQLNATAARLSSMQTWWEYTEVSLNQKKTLPVYTAPSEKAWRGAKGKAAVGLNSPFTRFASVTEDGDLWWLIEYDVSFSEKRIGYIQKPADAQGSESGVWFEERTVTFLDGTAMTDDPHGGRRTIATLGTNTQATSLGVVDAFWCYVQTQIDGKTARGFVPLCAIVLPERQQLAEIEERLESCSTIGDRFYPSRKKPPCT